MQQINLDSYIDDYVTMLVNNSNEISRENAGFEQKDMIDKAKFYRMLRDVTKIIAENPGLTIQEYRRKLFEASGIETWMRDYVFTRGAVSGINVTYGTEKYRETVTIGNRQEVSMQEGHVVDDKKPMEEDSIFDLASTSKTFTAISILKLCEEGILNLDDEVIKYAPQFINLKGITIGQLMTFQPPLITSSRIDRCSTKEAAEKVLFDIKVNEAAKAAYTDMGCMVLKYVVEGVTGLSMHKYISQTFLGKLGMNDTGIVIPSTKIDRAVATNLGVEIDKNGIIKRQDTLKAGTPFDPKARVTSDGGTSFSGHAGMFSTVGDMSKLARALNSSRVISDASLEQASNVGIVTQSQYYGSLNYLKNKMGHSEVPASFSARSIASPGWAGTYLVYDPINRIYMFSAASKPHNRLYTIAKEVELTLPTDEYGRRYVDYDGRRMLDTSLYAKERDGLREKVEPLLFQYKLLEDIFAQTKQDVPEEESHISIK